MRKVVIYDFACQLEEYCLARDPKYFKDVVFVIDHFHTYNHTCSRLYKISRYNVLDYLNSSICEQGNAWIKSGVHRQSKSMNDDLFFLTLMVQIALWNRHKSTITADAEICDRLLRHGRNIDPERCEDCFEV